MSNPIASYFRCPESLVRFFTMEKGASAPGYFRLGENVVAFGRLSCGKISPEVTASLHEALSDVQKNGATPVFPFEPGEIVENLRRERYLTREGATGSPSGWMKKLIRDAYYLARPLLPVAARKYLQRASLRNWQATCFPHWPVDTSVDDLHAVLLESVLKASGAGEIPFIWFWPDGMAGCAIMTHDVETTAGLHFCETLMDLNDSYGIKTSFQIVPEERYDVSAAWRRHIYERGFEVNVHDLNHDGHLFDEREEFLRRVRKINQYGKEFGARGFRAGVLYRNQDWLETLDFDYDMSVPNVAHLDPQHGGCCTVMPYFLGNLIELPVTCTQDYSLFNILQDYSTSLWEMQITRIISRHGMASFIVHPDYVIDKKARNAYTKLLVILAQLSAENKVWLALPREVACWWRDRSKMNLVRNGESWRIEGLSSDKARLAFAHLEDGKVKYRLAEDH